MLLFCFCVFLEGGGGKFRIGPAKTGARQRGGGGGEKRERRERTRREAREREREKRERAKREREERVIIYIYHELIGALSAHMTYINLSTIFYT